MLFDENLESLHILDIPDHAVPDADRHDLVRLPSIAANAARVGAGLLLRVPGRQDIASGQDKWRQGCSSPIGGQMVLLARRCSQL